MLRRTPANIVVEVYAQQRLAAIRSAVPHARRILDVGCGHGFSSYYLQRWAPVTVALDSSASLLTMNPVARRVRGIAERLPFNDNTFDLVNFWESLHHVEDAVVALREAARVTRRWVVIFEPNPLNPVIAVLASVLAGHRGILWRNWPTRMRRLLTSAGLRAVAVRGGGHILPNGTPAIALPVLRRLPYWSPLGVSLMVVGEKA